MAEALSAEGLDLKEFDGQSAPEASVGMAKSKRPTETRQVIRISHSTPKKK
jgi:hypothetical protein